jgi:hypothetical protein
MVMPRPADPHEPLELAPESNPATDRIRHLHPGGQPPEPAAPERKPDLVTRFLDLPRWEQYTGAAALVCLLGWLGASGWTSFLSLGSPGGWFFTLAIIGSLAVVVLVTTGGGRSSWFGLSNHARQRALISFALLPALGGAIELLQNFWAAVALVSATAMAYAAIRLALDKGD